APLIPLLLLLHPGPRHRVTARIVYPRALRGRRRFLGPVTAVLLGGYLGGLVQSSSVDGSAGSSCHFDGGGGGVVKPTGAPPVSSKPAATADCSSSARGCCSLPAAPGGTTKSPSVGSGLITAPSAPFSSREAAGMSISSVVLPLPGKACGAVAPLPSKDAAGKRMPSALLLLLLPPDTALTIAFTGTTSSSTHTQAAGASNPSSGITIA
ncbi:unnamed protein product, partial [Ectocarpus fasciculatus]